jgi:hypothetical protein
MASKQPKRSPKEAAGTWVRGADGDLYFIPDEDMKAFRVEGAEQGRRRSSGRGAARIQPLPALHGPSGLKDITIEGPLALSNLLAGPAAIVPPAITLRGLRDID